MDIGYRNMLIIDAWDLIDFVDRQEVPLGEGSENIQGLYEVMERQAERVAEQLGRDYVNKRMIERLRRVVREYRERARVGPLVGPPEYENRADWGYESN